MVLALVVEDDLPHYEIYLAILAHKGHTAIGATNGEMALEMLAREDTTDKTTIDIIFCDYNMPMMNGYDFSKTLKTDPKYVRYSNIPIFGIGDFPLNKREFLTDCKDKFSLKLVDFYAWIDTYCK